jgi:plastocyanin
MKSKWMIGLLLIGALMLAACGGTSSGAYGGGTSTGVNGGGTAQVVMKNISFQPSQITVATGTTVTWTNEDSVAHTVTSGTRGNPTGLFDSGDIAGGGTFSYTFDQPGTYDYYCRIHQGMNGQVIVQ